MNIYLYLSSGIAVIAAFVHSYIGEAILFRPLFAEKEHVGVMKSLTLRRISRAVWHLPSVCWLLMSAMTLLLSQERPLPSTPLYFAAAVYFLSGAGNFIATRGRNFGWVVLWIAALLLWLGIRN